MAKNDDSSTLLLIGLIGVGLYLFTRNSRTQTQGTSGSSIGPLTTHPQVIHIQGMGPGGKTSPSPVYDSRALVQTTEPLPTGGTWDERLFKAAHTPEAEREQKRLSEIIRKQAIEWERQHPNWQGPIPY